MYYCMHVNLLLYRHKIVLDSMSAIFFFVLTTADTGIDSAGYVILLYLGVGRKSDENCSNPSISLFEDRPVRAVAGCAVRLAPLWGRQ